MPYDVIPQSVNAFMQHITLRCGTKHAGWARDFNESFANTLLTTVRREQDGTTFLLTGDIPAMWLRDSTAQLRPYLVIAQHDDDLALMISGLVKRQFRYIVIDTYANAFNEEPNGNVWDANDKSDFTSPWDWERKYEVDSLCYPIQLAWLLYRNTGRTDQFNNDFVLGTHRILDIFEREQHHEHSPYFFMRDCDIPTETLSNNGRGTPVAYTGMTWSGFRPSDDACTYHYLVPSNMFAVVALDYLHHIFETILDDPDTAARARRLRDEIREGIERFATTTNTAGERVYAYEVDGLGHRLIMDDSNVPSLLSAPYLGYCDSDDAVYRSTRHTLLSSENPYYYSGEFAQGIGSSHTPPNYIWPIALAMQGLTTHGKNEQEHILDQLVATDAGTHLMHEGFDANDPNQFTRPWFSWANMMFCELVMDYFDIRVKQ